MGLTQGDLCLCGYDYAEKLLANCKIVMMVMVVMVVMVMVVMIVMV